MKIPFAKPNIEPEDWVYVNKALRQDKLTDGEYCKQFEIDFERYLNLYDNKVQTTSYCLATSSCMGALHLACMAIELKQGDEVLVPAMTHVATAHCVELTGAIPIFVDCDYNGNINLEKAEKLVTHKTKAIIILHYIGQSCNMSNVMNFVNSYGLKLIEDCALALGTRYKDQHVGTFGNYGCFSFYPAKHITTGEGGMLVCKSENGYNKARKISRFGKIDKAFLYDIDSLGLNYRMSEMQAALGISQLKRFDIEKRKENAKYFEKLYYKNFMTTSFIDGTYCVCIRFKSNEIRNRMFLHMKNKGIGISIYYPHPVPRLKYYQDKYGYKKKWFQNAEEIADCTLAFPIGNHVKKDDIDYMIEILKEGLDE